MPSTKIDPLIQGLLGSRPFDTTNARKYWEALKKLQQEDHMTWLISMSGTLVAAYKTVPAIINEDVLFLRMYARARVAPPTTHCLLQVWRGDGGGEYKYGPVIRIPKDSKVSAYVIPKTGGRDDPKNPQETDYFYFEVIQSGDAIDVTVAIECKRELGRISS